MTKHRNRAPLAGLLVAVVALSLTLSACNKEADTDLGRLFSLEGRSAKGAPPQEIEELKAGIERYAAEADRTVQANEQIGTYYRLLGARYLEKAMYLEAYNALIKALEYFPANEGLFYNAALSAALVAKSKAVLGPAGESERLRWLKIAESNYKRVLDSSPRSARALYGLAVLYEFELGQPEEALPLLRRVLEIETRNVDAMLLLGRVLYRLGRLEEAANVYESAAKVASGSQRMSGAALDKKKAAEENRARILEELYGKAASE